MHLRKPSTLSVNETTQAEPEETHVCLPQAALDHPIDRGEQSSAPPLRQRAQEMTVVSPIPHSQAAIPHLWWYRKGRFLLVSLLLAVTLVTALVAGIAFSPWGTPWPHTAQLQSTPPSESIDPLACAAAPSRERCEQSDPDGSSCLLDAQTRAQTPLRTQEHLPIGVMTLRYSAACQSYWVDVTCMPLLTHLFHQELTMILLFDHMQLVQETAYATTTRYSVITAQERQGTFLARSALYYRRAPFAHDLTIALYFLDGKSQTVIWQAEKRNT